MKPYLVGIAGPSGAGKSEFCRRMQNDYQGVTRLKLDDFFVDKSEIGIKDGFQDWDRPDAIKWPQLIKAAQDLKKGRAAVVPNYSRKDDRVIGEKCVFSSEIILVDGFMTLYHPELRNLLDFKIFFKLSEHSQLRRRRERQPWVEEGYLHHIMLPAARQYIMPGAQYADLVINAELPSFTVADMCMGAIQAQFELPLTKTAPSVIYAQTSVKTHA